LFSALGFTHCYPAAIYKHFDKTCLALNMKPLRSLLAQPFVDVKFIAPNRRQLLNLSRHRLDFEILTVPSGEESLG
jgi:hypothetical protein